MFIPQASSARHSATRKFTSARRDMNYYFVFTKMGSFVGQFRDKKEAQKRLESVPGGYIQVRPIK